MHCNANLCSQLHAHALANSKPQAATDTKYYEEALILTSIILQVNLKRVSGFSAWTLAKWYRFQASKKV